MLFYQGSMVLWHSTSLDAQLYQISNATNADYVWIGNKLTPLKDSANNTLKIFLQSFLTQYVYTQNINPYLSFPYPGTFNLTWTMSNSSKTANCSIVVTDGMLLKILNI